MFQMLIFVFSSSIIGLFAASDPCQLHSDDNKFVYYNTVCLQFVTHKYDWKDARADCRRHGGDLVTITEPDKEQFILNHLHMMNWKHSVSKGVWLGASDQDTEGIWLWIDGSPVRYGDWHSGQGPSHHGFFFTGGMLEDCAQLRLDDGGKWHDYPCRGGPAYHYSYICQYHRAGIQSMTSSSSVKSTVMPMSTSALPSYNTTIGFIETNSPMSTKMPTVSKTMSTLMSTISKTMSTQMPTVSKIMSTQMPTVSKTISTEMPTVSEIMSTQLPTVSKTMSTQMPTNDKPMSTQNAN